MARQNNNGNNRAKLDKIYEVFDKLKVDIDRDSIWEVQGTPVVKHKDVERLGAAMGIKWDKPQILRAEPYEAVMIVYGTVGEKMEWSIGEAKIMEMVGTGKNNQWGKEIKQPKDGSFGNYVVTGNQAAYPYAMAEKRAKDRVILKLADLHGDAYSSEEADDFKRPDGPQTSNDNNRSETQGRGNAPADDVATDDSLPSAKEIDAILDKWEAEIAKCTTNAQVVALVGEADFKADLALLHVDDEKFLRKLANDKSKALKAARDSKSDAA